MVRKKDEWRLIPCEVTTNPFPFHGKKPRAGGVVRALRSPSTIRGVLSRPSSSAPSPAPSRWKWWRRSLRLSVQRRQRLDSPRPAPDSPRPARFHSLPSLAKGVVQFAGLPGVAQARGQPSRAKPIHELCECANFVQGSLTGFLCVAERAGARGCESEPRN